MQDVCGQIAAGCGRSTSEVESGSHVHHGVEQAGAYGGAKQLEHYVAGAFTAAHATGQEHGERYGGVYMAAGNVAKAIAQTHKYKAEAQSDAEPSDRRAGEHCATAGEKNQKHCSDTFSK